MHWGSMLKLNLYIVIVFILPTIGEYMLVGIIFCYWIYSANNWGICVNWRGHILEYTYSRIYICILEYMYIF